MKNFISNFAMTQLFFMVLSCSEHNNEILTNHARQLMEKGMFSRVIEIADSLDGEFNADQAVRREIDSMADYAVRYMIDFPYTEDDILDLLRSGSVEADEEALRTWEDQGELEFMNIDGEKRYFRWAHRNLYRINDSLRAEKQIDKQRNESLHALCINEIEDIFHYAGIRGYGEPGNNDKNRTGDSVQPAGMRFNPRKMRINYTITVDADAVPEGEMIRCWMPYPREDSPRQDMVNLISAFPGEYIIAPGNVKQRSIYFEQAAAGGEATVFSLELEYRSWSQFFDPEILAVSSDNHVPDSLLPLTVERLPHISFSNGIRELAGGLVTDSMGPYEKAKAFYRWINDNIIWTSAVEYGLMHDIPGYVLKNGRGDCGMQTLLFLSLCRYAGIPAKWQSGWMMHPGHVNLHDWSEIWLDQAGWVPVDVSFKLQPSDNPLVEEFYISGMDSYRLIVNDDYGRDLYPRKIYPRSEPLDFQRGELEWDGGNIYFDRWSYNMQVEYY